MKFFKKTLFFFILLCTPASHVFCQQRVSGRVYDNAGEPLEGVNVLLLRAADSSMVGAALSATGGTFSINAALPGNYLLSFSYSGFVTFYQEVTLEEKALVAIKDVMLQPADHLLDAVTVTAHKPLFEQQVDRLVVNVRNSITSVGGTVLSVLQRSPGVLLDRQSGTISLNGKTGVQVMINGKMRYMPADALIAMLEGMSADNVEKIELISTPPARYDAGGNAGYIHIVLVKNPNEGFNGNISLTLAAFHGTFPMANADFNYRRKKSNLYGSLGSSRWAQQLAFKNYRRINQPDKLTESEATSHRDPFRFNNNLNLGYDYTLNKRTTIGALFSGYNNQWKMSAANTSSAFINHRPDSVITLDIHEVNHWKNFTGNINLQHQPDEKQEISINIDYLIYDNKNPTRYQNDYYNGKGEFAESRNLFSNKHTVIRMLPAQVDYKGKISDKASFESGLKAVFNSFTNDVAVEWLQNGNRIPDPEFSADYTSEEKIGAAYFSANWQAGSKNTFQAGLRYEYTSTNLGTALKKNIIDRKYGEWFPTLYWSRILNSQQQLTLAYNRRINRPSFNDLAPFIIFVDPNTFMSGNSALQPSLSNALKVDYIFRQWVFSAGYTYEKNAISPFQVTMDVARNKQYMTAQNLDYLKTLNGSVTLPITFTSWWRLQALIQVNQQQVRASFTGKANELSIWTGSVSGSQNFTLGKQYAAEVSGHYQTKTLFGVGQLKPLGIVNLAVRKKNTRTGATWIVGVDDIFSGNKLEAIVDVPEEHYYAKGNFQFGKRIFKLTFSYPFGNTSLKDKRSRSTASETERKRMGN